MFTNPFCTFSPRAFLSVSTKAFFGFSLSTTDMDMDTVKLKKAFSPRLFMIHTLMAFSVWDMATGQCTYTLDHHNNAVNAVAWNLYVPKLLLTGSLDCTKDGRDPSNSGLKWSTKVEVEDLAWDPHSEHSFVVSLKDGTVKGFDIRDSSLSSSFTLNAHDEEVSSVSYNTDAPNLLATGPEEESVKLWDLSNNQPSWIATHNPNAGEVFSVSFSADSPFLLAIGGSEGKLKVWDTLSESAVSRRYGKRLAS